MLMFIAALFAISPKVETTTHTVDRYMDKQLWSVYTMEQFSGVKKYMMF